MADNCLQTDVNNGKIIPKRRAKGMEKQNATNGGPAFPSPESGGQFTGDDGHTFRQYQAAPGMTLRDYFAAAALTGCLAEGAASSKVIDCGGEGSTYKRAMTSEEFTSYVWHLADAMLKSRGE